MSKFSLTDRLRAIAALSSDIFISVVPDIRWGRVYSAKGRQDGYVVYWLFSSLDVGYPVL